MQSWLLRNIKSLAIGTENSDLDAREHQLRIEIQQVKRTSGLRQGRPATASTVLTGTRTAGTWPMGRAKSDGLQATEQVPTYSNSR